MPLLPPGFAMYLIIYGFWDEAVVNLMIFQPQSVLIFNHEYLKIVYY